MTSRSPSARFVCLPSRGSSGFIGFIPVRKHPDCLCAPHHRGPHLPFQKPSGPGTYFQQVPTAASAPEQLQPRVRRAPMRQRESSARSSRCPAPSPPSCLPLWLPVFFSASRALFRLSLSFCESGKRPAASGEFEVRFSESRSPLRCGASPALLLLTQRSSATLSARYPNEGR